VIKIFKTSESFVLLLLVVYAIVVNFNLFINPPAFITSSSAPLSQWLLNGIDFIAQGNSVVLSIIFLILVLMQASILNFLVDYHKLFNAYTSLPAFCYILLIALFNEHIYFSPAFFANFAILVTLTKIYASYNTQSYTYPFDAGFAVGIASLFYFPAIILSIFVFIGLGSMRVFNWREWLLAFMSILTPYVLLCTAFFMGDGLSNFLQTHLLSGANTIITPVTLNFELIIKTGIILAIILIAMLFFQGQFYKRVVKIRKMLTLLVHLMSISVGAFLLINQFSLVPLAMFLLPLSVFFAYIFFEVKSTLTAELIHISILLPLFFFQYATIYNF